MDDVSSKYCIKLVIEYGHLTVTMYLTYDGNYFGYTPNFTSAFISTENEINEMLHGVEEHLRIGWLKPPMSLEALPDYIPPIAYSVNNLPNGLRVGGDNATIYRYNVYNITPQELLEVML